MLAKKSWDVERKPARPVAKQSPPIRTNRTIPAKPRRAEQRVVATRPLPRATVSKEPLKIRRARERRMYFIALGIFAVVVLGALLYAAWMPSLRVDVVNAEGPQTESVTRVAQEELMGTHLFIVPKNSIFFLPESSIRNRILSEQPSIVAVSIKSSGLNAITVISLERSSAFLWCGATYDTPTPTCFHTDPDGLVFAPYEPAEPIASSSMLLKVYVPLAEAAQEPVGAHTEYTAVLPNSLRLAKSFRALGTNISGLAFRNDEADFYTSAGTRITYVIGRETEAAQLAASVFPKLLLNDGSVDYVDLRFEGKVYLRKGAPEPQVTVEDL